MEIRKGVSQAAIGGDAAADEDGLRARLFGGALQFFNKDIDAGGLEARGDVGDLLARQTLRPALSSFMPTGVIEHGRLQAAERKIKRLAAEGGAGEVDRRWRAGFCQIVDDGAAGVTQAED